MKRDVAKLLRTVVGLIEDELPELRDSIVQADERAADAMHLALDVEGRLQTLEQAQQQAADARQPVLDRYSTKV